MAWHWQLLQQECVGCGVCADVCTYSAILLNRVTAYPASVAGRCAGCVECVEQCPVEAVVVTVVRTAELA